MTVTETLSSDLIYATSGAGDALAFNLSDNSAPGLTIGNVTTNFAYEGSGSYHDDGTGTFTNAVDCTSCGAGTSPPTYTGPISFTVTDTALDVTAADFVANSDGNFFSSDVGAILTGGNGNTGDVASNSGSCTSGPGCGGGGPQSLPEPVSIGLTAGGLIALGLFRRKISFGLR